MKNIIRNFTVLALGLAACSCNDSFLDRYPSDQVTDENFWQSEVHLRSASNVFTRSLGGKDMLNRTEIAADLCPWAVTTAWRTIGGGNYATDISQINSLWTNCYTNIGRINYFLNNYNRAVSVKEEVRERFAAEAYFYRAYNYWLLTNYFGDVPFIREELNVTMPDVFRGRDPRSEVIDAITKDLEDHYRALPEYIAAGSSEFGHVSQTAALALLSRIYLYNERWEDAVNAAERAMQSPYYSLYTTGKPDRDYCDLFTYEARASRKAANREVLLAYVYNYDLGEDARTSHNLSREIWVPNDFSRFVPTNSAIELFLASDGKIWNPADAASYEDVFKNRDPRMTQSILAPGTAWEGGRLGVDDTHNTDLGIYTYPKFSNTRAGCMTYSGYYLRKYVEPSTVQFVGHDDNDIVILRFAEVLLNYAEAKERMGTLNQHDLDISINLLRDRVGMVHMDLGSIPAGSSITTEIQRERSVELFFEGHRYFDLIRWKQGAKLGGDLLGVNRRWIDTDRISINIDKDLKWKTVGGEKYLLIESGRSFNEPKHYLLSIPFAQSQLNPNLLPNNPGWQ